MNHTERQNEMTGAKLIVVLVAIASLNPIASTVIVPALPSIRTDIGADVATVQLVLSGYLIATAIGQLFVGTISDRLGRRPVLFAGMIVFILAGIACALATSMSTLVAARVIQGIGGCAGVVISRAVLRDVFDRDRAASALGYVTMGMAVAPMIGPVLGGAVDQTLGWRAIFVIGSIAAVLILGTMWVVLPETKSADERRQSGSPYANFAALLVVPAFWAYALATAFTAGVWFSFLSGAPFVATEFLGLDAVKVGISLAVTSVGYFVGNFLSGRYSQRLGVPFMIACGNSVQVITVIFMVFLFMLGWLNIWTFFVPVTFICIGNGIALPNAIAGSLSVRPALSGTASGAGGSLQFGMGAVGVAVTGFSLGVAPSALTLALVMTVFALLAALASVWSRYARS